MKKFYRGTQIEWLVRSAAKTFKQSEKNKHMDQLKLDNPATRDWLLMEPFERWAGPTLISLPSVNISQTTSGAPATPRSRVARAPKRVDTNISMARHMSSVGLPPTTPNMIGRGSGGIGGGGRRSSRVVRQTQDTKSPRPTQASQSPMQTRASTQQVQVQRQTQSRQNQSQTQATQGLRKSQSRQTQATDAPRQTRANSDDPITIGHTYGQVSRHLLHEELLRRLKKAFRKIHVRLATELEKKFSGKDELLVLAEEPGEDPIYKNQSLDMNVLYRAGETQ
ncbi:hypothetical protein GIB67_015844 [Kingdonia uniflora]|uniref:Uncharacterized protein n=1 Tax=Kingdonia uniflora TaxID=39325 RepID=A0A7J7NE61_9MAGN|nr:hypothetical protein GIB67_015844 [Kingdonia uniflora]